MTMTTNSISTSSRSRPKTSVRPTLDVAVQLGYWHAKGKRQTAETLRKEHGFSRATAYRWLARLRRIESEGNVDGGHAGTTTTRLHDTTQRSIAS